MKIEHLTNRVASFGSELQAALAACNSFSIATAFISADAIELMEQTLKKGKRVRDSRLLIGLYGCFNHKADLERLLRLAQLYAGRLQVNISRSKVFHWKYYGIVLPRKTVAFTGSANFTSGGLGGNDELVLKLSGSGEADEKVFKSLGASFDEEWKSSVPISEFPLALYPAKSARPVTVWPKKLREFFDHRESSASKIHSVPSDKVFVTFLTADVSKATREKVYGYNPTWTASELNFFVCDNLGQFRQCRDVNRVLVIVRLRRSDFRAHWVEPVYFCDSIRTNEGSYFVAYEDRSKWQPVTPKIEERLLGDLGINLRARAKPFRTKLLRKRQASKIRTLIKE